MKRHRLGHSDLWVSPFCLGCMSFGKPGPDTHAWTLDPEQSETIIVRALELGINFFDTANTYSAGTSEQYLGRALKKHAQRADVVIASKVYFNDGHLSRTAIHREIEGTLRNLGTDYLDLYIIHRFDETTPMEETMGALHSLVQSGKVRALGASAMMAHQFHNLQIIAERHGYTPFTAMQNHYNLLYREDERDLIPICRQYDVALTPYSPLASGHLSRPEWRSDSHRSRTDAVMRMKYDRTEAEDMKIVARVEELAARKGCSMTQIALAWHLAKGVTAPVIGATKVHYLDDAVGAVDIRLTPEDIAYLEEPYIPHEIMGPILPGTLFTRPKDRAK